VQKQVEDQSQRIKIMQEAQEVQRAMQEVTERTIAERKQAELAQQHKQWRIRNQEWVAQKAIDAVRFTLWLEVVLRISTINCIISQHVYITAHS
jgi:hypothetical protein